MKCVWAGLFALVLGGEPKVILGDRELSVEDIRKLDVKSLKDGETVSIVKEARKGCAGPKLAVAVARSKSRTWSGERHNAIEYEAEASAPEGARKLTDCVRLAVLTKSERGDALEIRRLDLGAKGEAKEGEKRALKGTREAKLSAIDAEIKECPHGGRLALVIELEDGHGCSLTRIVLVPRRE